MSYLHCRRCGLQIRIQATLMSAENCPRCLARTATVSRLQERAKWIRPAVGGWGPKPADRADGRHAQRT